MGSETAGLILTRSRGDPEEDAERQKEAAAVEAAIEAVLTSGRVTADLRPAGVAATTGQVGEAVCAAIG